MELARNSQLWAILLAAGAGRRLGGVCKALLNVQGETLIARQLSSMFRAGIQHCIVVTGFQGDRVQAAVTETPGLANRVTFAEVANFQSIGDNDIQRSVRHGLSALRDVASRKQVNVVLSLIDLPLLQSAHVIDLTNFAQQQGAHIVIPQSQDRQPGHPIFLSNAALSAMDLLQPDFSLRRWMHQSAHGLNIVHMPKDDPAYFADIDTPDDLAAFAEQYRLQISLPTT